MDGGKTDRKIQGFGDADEGGRVPLLRGGDEEEREDESGRAEVEVRLLRRLDDALLRRHSREARRVPGMADVEGCPALDVWVGKGVQEEGGRVLAGVAHVRADG